MSAPKLRFVIVGEMLRAKARRWERVSFFIDADDREDARWQTHHGAIEANIRVNYPGATIRYDRRRMRLHYNPYAGSK